MLGRDARNGTTARLELKDPDAFQPEPDTPGGKNGSAGGTGIGVLVRKSEEAYAAQKEYAHAE